MISYNSYCQLFGESITAYGIRFPSSGASVPPHLAQVSPSSGASVHLCQLQSFKADKERGPSGDARTSGMAIVSIVLASEVGLSPIVQGLILGL